MSQQSSLVPQRVGEQVLYATLTILTHNEKSGDGDRGYNNSRGANLFNERGHWLRQQCRVDGWMCMLSIELKGKDSVAVVFGDSLVLVLL